VTTLAPHIDAPVDYRFGRAACFVVADGETLERAGGASRPGPRG
jgi:hypothetical protein